MAMDLFAFVDAIKFLSDTNDFDIKKGLANMRRNPSSVAQIARKNICQFPLLMSDTLSVEGCSEVSLILEELYANYIKIVIDNNNDIIDLNKIENKSEFISSFHQNDSVGNYGMNPIDDYETLKGMDFENLGESTKYITDESTRFLAKSRFSFETLNEANKELLKPYNENFNYSNTNSDINGSYLGNKILNEAPNDIANVQSLINEIKSEVIRIRKDMHNYTHGEGFINLRQECLKFIGSGKSNGQYNVRLQNNDIIDRGNELIISLNSAITAGDIILNDIRNLQIKYSQSGFKTLVNSINNTSNYFNNVDDIKLINNLYNNIISSIGDIESNNRTEVDSKSIIQNIINGQEINNLQLKRLEADIKNTESQTRKNNLQADQIEKELNRPTLKNFQASSYVTSITKQNSVLSPTVISVELQYNAGEGRMYHTKLDIGIKTIIHMIPSAEMCYFLPDTLIKKRLSFRFIQWTTGEIKFMKDFLLDLDNVKFQATTDKKSVKWWKHLNTRRNAAKVRSFTNRKVNFVPNATVVLSTADVEFIKYKHNIDLRKNTNAAAKLMDYFFLLHLVIVDEVEGTLTLFHADNRNWETVSFDRLKAETRNELKKNNGVVQFSR